MTLLLRDPVNCFCVLKVCDCPGQYRELCSCYVTQKVLFCEFCLLSNLALTPRRQNGRHFKVTDDARKRLQAANCGAILILDNKLCS